MKVSARATSRRCSSRSSSTRSAEENCRSSLISHRASPRPVGSSTAGIFTAFLKLGCTSFGGPIAHLGYLRQEFVERRKWLDDESYGDLVALCQFLPGPASSQLGIALGLSRGGLSGAIAAWLGFTLPSAIIMVAFAYGLQVLHVSTGAGWIHGLKIAAVAVVAQAVWRMGRQLCPDRMRASIAVAAALVVLGWSNVLAQIAVIAAGGLLGRSVLKTEIPRATHHLNFRISRRAATAAWVLFFGLLALLPIVARLHDGHGLAMFDSLFRSGSLVFGGGHVVLPLLRAEVVPPGWITDDTFLAGYGLAQALPGPLFTFAAFLGTTMTGPPNGWGGGLLALVAIFLPAFLVLFGALPYWDAWRKRQELRSAFSGVNAAVVGILLAALYDPIFTSAIRGPGDFGVAVAAFALLEFWKIPPLGIVLLAAGGGILLAAV